LNRETGVPMGRPPLLEDQTYPGRTGGYVTRITGKLLQESAIAGHRNLFLPSPNPATSSYVYGGSDVTGTPLFEVPGEFYALVFARIAALFGPDAVGAAGERTVTYSGRPFAISIGPASKTGTTLGIRPVGEGAAGAAEDR
jgi:hypothetical protein